MRLRFVVSVVTGVVLAIHAPKAPAAVLTYKFAGALDAPFGTLPSGTPFSGSFSYDDSQPLNTPVHPYVGEYHYTSFSIAIGGDTVTDNGTGGITIYDQPYPTDLFFLWTSPIPGTIGGLTLGGLTICLQDLTKTAFNSPLPPGPCLAFCDFTPGNATFLELSSGSFSVRGELTELFMSSVVNDQTLPTLVATVANCLDDTVTVTFSEPLNKSTAEIKDNYLIGGGISISKAVLSSDRLSVCLFTSGLAPATWYSLAVSGVMDRCGNLILANSQIPFSCPSEIHGRVYADQNSDCQFTAGTDWPLGNWQVQLDQGGPVTTTTTDANGEYNFIVAPGNYTVSEVLATHWAQTCPLTPFTSYHVNIGPAQLVSGQPWLRALPGRPTPQCFGLDAHL